MAKLSIDEALRYYLGYFNLPGEAQQIERVLEAFINRFYETNSSDYPDLDTAFCIAFSLIMLNTDLHNPMVKKKMSKAEYIYNARGTWGDNEDPPRELLERLYNSIAEDEIMMNQEFGEQASKKGFLKKQAKRKWKKKYFTLQDNCLYYFKRDQKNFPEGIIPLENISVEELGDMKFILQGNDGGYIKSCKMESGKMVQGKLKRIVLAAESLVSRDSWVKVLRANTSVNPFYEMMKKRMKSVNQDSESVSGDLWRNYYKLLLQCKTALLTRSKIRKQYGKNTEADTYKSISYMILKNMEKREYTILLNGIIWSNEFESIIDKGLKKNFEWEEFFEFEEINNHLLEKMEVLLEKEYSVVIAGYELGGMIAIQLGCELKRKFFHVTEAVVFSCPAIIREEKFLLYETLNIVRIMEKSDPSLYLFAGHYSKGKDITIDGSTYVSKLGKKKVLGIKRGSVRFGSGDHMKNITINTYLKHLQRLLEV